MHMPSRWISYDDESTTASSGGAAATTPVQITNDLLVDLFGGGFALAVAPSSPTSAPSENLIHGILCFFDITLAGALPTSISTPTLT
ncbi:hypothetical protein FRC12_008705 [Ceratobasidium sp. 428]|nr:hypothetical protein FRC12_008705 [Ceratobasidium sp. 428]